MALTQPKLSDYFASISPLTSRMVEEAKEVICREGEHWNQMNQEEKDLAMDNHFLSSTISSQYENTSTLDCGDVRELTLDKIFPRLKLQRGQETVHYKEGDREEAITYKDEFSGDFCWETKSQMEFKLDTVHLPGIFHTTPPPSRRSKTGHKPSRKHSFKKNRKEARLSEPESLVSETRSSSVRPLSDESIGTDCQSPLTASSTERTSRAASQGSYDSGRASVPPSSVRTSQHLTNDNDSFGELLSSLVSQQGKRRSTEEGKGVPSQPASNNRSAKSIDASRSTNPPLPKAAAETVQVTASKVDTKPVKARATPEVGSTGTNTKQTSTFDFLSNW